MKRKDFERLMEEYARCMYWVEEGYGDGECSSGKNHDEAEQIKETIWKSVEVST